jgi:hypothetical protein
MKNKLYRKGLVFGIVILFIGTYMVPGIGGKHGSSKDYEDSPIITSGVSNSATLSLHTFDKTVEKQKNNVEIPADAANEINIMLEELKQKIVNEPMSDETKALKIEFVNLLDKYDLLPNGLSKDYVLSLLNPSWLSSKQKIPRVRPIFPVLRNFVSRILSVFSNLQQFFKMRFGKTSSQDIIRDVLPTTQYSQTASAIFCSMGSGGRGSVLPLFLLPRPRGIAVWSATEGVTAVAELLSPVGAGFGAEGAQSGLALGFIGLGLTFAFPGNIVYGFFGYALFTSVSADNIVFFPPNEAPVISDENPVDGTWDVPLSFSKLSFRINDPEGKLMSYTVTTDPDIGSGSGILKTNGVYSVPVSGLEGLTEYTWHIQVSDDKVTTVKDFTFTTEPVAPVVSNPSPKDGSRHISVELDHLSFTLKDFQGDYMDYTIETYPDIGSGSGFGVEDGVYTLLINHLESETEYTWYVNVTDGNHWTYQKFTFRTRVDPGLWWDESWSYRKYLGLDDASSDYQMVLQVWKEDGHDNQESGIIDCENHCNEDFSDIRFVTFDGVKCNYWIEKTGINSGDHYANIWVKTPSTGDEQLYLYYGNPEAFDESDGSSTFVFFDDFDSYQDGETDPGDWSIKTCSFETSCSVICDKNNAYSGKCLIVRGRDATSSSPKDEYSVAKNEINLEFDTYEIQVYMKPDNHRPEEWGYVRIDGNILISKNNWGDWWKGTAIFSEDVIDIELVCRFNQLWNGQIDIYFDNLFIRKYQTNEPSWSYFGEEEHSP